MLCSNDALHGINSPYNFDQRFFPLTIQPNVFSTCKYYDTTNVLQLHIHTTLMRMIEIERDTNIRDLTKQ